MASDIGKEKLTSLSPEVFDSVRQKKPDGGAAFKRFRSAASAARAYIGMGLLALALAALATHLYISVNRELTEAAMARRLAIAQLAAATHSERLDRMVDLAVSLATRVRFADLVSAGQWEAAVAILQNIPSDFPLVDRIVLYDVDGVLMADVPRLPEVKGRNFAHRDWYQGVSRAWKPYVSQVYQRAARPQRYVFAVAVPIANRSGATAGILQVQVHLERFFDWANAIDLGPAGVVYIVDGKGTVAFDSASNATAQFRDLSANPAVSELLRGQSGVRIAADPTDGAHVYAFVPSRHGWGVVTQQPTAQAFAARASQLNRLLIGYVVIFAFCVATLFLASRIAMERRRAEKRIAERLRILREIDRAVAAEEAPQAIASAIIQPLRELLGVPRAIVNKFDLAAGEAEWIAAAGRRRNHAGTPVRYPIGLMGDVEALRRGEVQRIDVTRLQRSADVEALLASGVHAYMVVPMIAGGELIGAISFGGAADVLRAEQIGIVQETATQLAIAMRQSSLLERVKRHADELETRVRERTAALESVNKELETFSYSVSHDLRAPLRAVDGYAQMLEEDYGARLDDEGRRLLGVVRESSQRMGRLIDDLLAFSRLGRQQPVKTAVDVGELVREVLAENARDSTAQLSIETLPTAHAERALLKQVWVNLISNALKFSSKRADARVAVGAREEARENVYWVRDNGAGFDMRYAEKLFRVFQRLHHADEFPGTGVGLAIVQRVISRHGGRVWAEGRPGEGACFYFSLPRDKANS